MPVAAHMIERSYNFNNRWISGFFKILVLILFAFAFAVSDDYVKSGICKLDFGIMIRFIFFLVIGIAILRYAPRLLEGLQRSEANFKSFGCSLTCSTKLKFQVMLFLLLCWLPYYIILWPGTLSNDTTSQLSAFIGRFVLGDALGVYDRNPLFDTFVFGIIIYGVGSLVGNLKMGIAVYVLAQLLALSLVFTSVVSHAKRWGCSNLLCSIILLFFAFFPLIPIWGCNVSKDTLFCLFFIPFLTQYVDMCLINRDVRLSWSRVIAFSALCVLVSLTKKTGMYIVIISLVGYAIFNYKNSKKVYVALASTLLVMFLILPGITKALDVKSGGRQEMLAVPLQQTARCVAIHGDDVTEAEREAIDRLLDYDSLAERYTFWNADPVKGFSELGDLDDYIAWFKAWVTMGIRHPITYFHAFAALEAPWVSFTPISALFNSDHHVSSIEEYIPEDTYEQPALLRFLSNQLSEAYAALQGLPVMGLLFGTGLYSFIIPLFTALLLFNKNGGRGLILCLPFLVTVATLFVSPVAVGQEAARYILGLVYSAPIQLALCAREYFPIK